MSLLSTFVAYVDGILALLLALSFSFLGHVCVVLLLPSFAAVSLSILSYLSFALVLSFAGSFVSFSMSFSGLAFVPVAFSFIVAFSLVAFALSDGSYVHWCGSSAELVLTAELGACVACILLNAVVAL